MRGTNQLEAKLSDCLSKVRGWTPCTGNCLGTCGRLVRKALQAFITHVFNNIQLSINMHVHIVYIFFTIYGGPVNLFVVLKVQRSKSTRIAVQHLARSRRGWGGKQTRDPKQNKTENLGKKGGMMVTWRRECNGCCTYQSLTCWYPLINLLANTRLVVALASLPHVPYRERKLDKEPEKRYDLSSWSRQPGQIKHPGSHS